MKRRIAERMAMLLDITQAATSSLELEQILKIAVEKVSQVLPTDRCSVVLVDSPSSTEAVVMATRERDDYRPITIDLSKYPELRRSLQTREATYIEDALEDPLMADVMPAIAPLGVKSILVQPLISQDDLVGALFLRLSRRRGAFGPEEQEFAKAVAAALANSVRNAKLHASVQKKRDDLELAYVERYRELTEANRRLRELARFKDELIAIISHDLRAPLQVTLGHGRMLEDANLPGDLRTSAEAIVRQSRKILKMVESLLDRGKGEQARVALDVQLLDVGRVARDCAFELEILAAERGVTLSAHAPERLPVMGDELKLREVLQNLITNGLEHAAKKGTVLVEGEVLHRPDGPVVKVVVQDDGPGHARGADAPGLRPLPARAGRDGPRPRHLQGVRRAARRGDLGRAARGRRMRLRLHPAARPGGPEGRPRSSRPWSASSPGCSSSRTSRTSPPSWRASFASATGWRWPATGARAWRRCTRSIRTWW